MTAAIGAHIMLEHLERALDDIVQARFTTRQWQPGNSVHQIEMYLALQAFDGIVDAICRVTHEPMERNEVIRRGTAEIKRFIEYMCRDNAGLHDLYEPYASRYSEALRAASEKRVTRRAEEDLLFCEVGPEYMRRWMTKFVVDRRMSYEEMEGRMMADYHDAIVQAGQRTVQDWETGVRNALNTVAAMALAESISVAINVVSTAGPGQTAAYAIDVDVDTLPGTLGTPIREVAVTDSELGSPSSARVEMADIA